jgi:hypothetical protein
VDYVRGVAYFRLQCRLSGRLIYSYRRFINQSGTDDVLQKLVCLVLMAILAGHSANASGITLGHNVISRDESQEGASVITSCDPALVAAAAFFLGAKFMHGEVK